jgi:hypothetical protein
MNSPRFIYFILSFCLLCKTATAAGISVTGNSYNVAAGTPVTAQFLVSNSSLPTVSQIEGMTFTVQIGAGTNLAPSITSVDLLTGTIWSSHVTAGNITTPLGGNQLQYQSRDIITDLPSDYVDLNGLLATINIDTTGAMPGDYSIILTGTNTIGRDSEFLNGSGDPIQATFGVANLTIVPEPSTLVLGTLAGLGLGALSLRRRSVKS